MRETKFVRKSKAKTLSIAPMLNLDCHYPLPEAWQQRSSLLYDSSSTWLLDMSFGEKSSSLIFSLKIPMTHRIKTQAPQGSSTLGFRCSHPPLQGPFILTSYIPHRYVDQLYSYRNLCLCFRESLYYEMLLLDVYLSPYHTHAVSTYFSTS